jgi:hypothetical protein
MKQPTIAKSQVRKSQFALQWLMHHVAAVSPCSSGMGNNTIKTHLVLHLGEDILDHGVPDNVNSAYAESAHIPLAKVTAKNTQNVRRPSPSKQLIVTLRILSFHSQTLIFWVIQQQFQSGQPC